MFKHHDRNSSNSIDAKELRACLFSLGEESTKAAVDRYMKEFGSAGSISLTGFRRLMTHLLGVSHNKDEIVDGFTQIARDDNVVQQAALGKFLPAAELGLFCAAAPQQDGGFNFRQWTASVFAR
jgi:Ca2+-binding EF-hand superfamily protein